MTPRLNQVVLGWLFLTSASVSAADPAARVENFNFSIFEVTAGSEVTFLAPTPEEVLLKSPNLSAVSVYAATDWSPSLDVGDGATRWGSLSRVMEANPGLIRRAEELLGEWRAQDAVRRAADSDSDGLLGRAMRTVFPEPAVFQLGPITVGGGVVNAIRQRNPFYLLNPLHVFWLSF